MSEADFEKQANGLCADHSDALEGLFDTSFDMAWEGDAESGSVLAQVEVERRELLVRSRDLIADLRRIEPLGREVEWRSALGDYEAAIVLAGDGDRVDVHADGLFESASRIADEFGLDQCY